MPENSKMWEEVIPSRLRVLSTYTKRVYNWNRNSTPFLSGDLFADQSDLSIFGPNFRVRNSFRKEISNATVIFCPSEKLQTLFDVFGEKIRAKVILCSNSDFEFHKLPKSIPPSVKQLFLQNSFISDNELVTTLPIGIENIRWGMNGFPRLMTSSIPWNQRINKVLVGPFGLTHPLRYQVRDELILDSDSIEFVDHRYSPNAYSKLMQTFRYVAAVRGNGVDTHRHWEALYRGVIPIVLRDEWTANLSALKLPFLEVSSWNIEELKVILEMGVDRTFSPKELPALWWPYWKDLINSYL